MLDILEHIIHFNGDGLKTTYVRWVDAETSIYSSQRGMT